MKIRIYKGNEKKFPVDAWTVYFPYPKAVQEREEKESGHRILGFFYSGHPDEHKGFYVLSGDDFDMNRGYIDHKKLGRRVHGNNIPQPMQTYVANLQHLYDEALRIDTTEAWDSLISAVG